MPLHKALELVAFRQLEYHGFTFGEILVSFLDRTFEIESGIGKVVAIWRELDRAKELGLRGRRRCGILDMDVPPESRRNVYLTG